MRWKAKPYCPKKWKNKFAFLPRKIGNMWVWLEPYEQRWAGSDCDIIEVASPVYERRTANGLSGWVTRELFFNLSWDHNPAKD